MYNPYMYAGTPATRTATSISPLYTVASLQEVRMAQPNYDGTPIYFLVSKDNSIVSKQMDMNGLVVLKTYKEETTQAPQVSQAPQAPQVPSSLTSNSTVAIPDDLKAEICKYIDKKLEPISTSLSELNALISKKEDINTNVSNDVRTESNGSSTGINGNDGHDGHDGHGRTNEQSKSVF